MSIIGTFKHDAKADTYTGDIVTLTFSRTDVQFTPNKKSGEKQPDYRLVGQTAHGIVEFGSAWKRTSNAGNAYLSVEIDDPALPDTLYAALCLGQNGRGTVLLWSRRKSGNVDDKPVDEVASSDSAKDAPKPKKKAA